MRNWSFLLNERAQKARAIIIVSATALLFVAMFFSFKQMPADRDAQVYTGKVADGESASVDSVDALSSFESDRTASRIAQFEALDKLINSDDETASEEAAQQKMELVGFMETETTLEGLLKAQGFKDAVCTVHADSCNVLVRAKTLSDAQTARILTIASGETGLSAANIKIIPVA